MTTAPPVPDLGPQARAPLAALPSPAALQAPGDLAEKAADLVRRQLRRTRRTPEVRMRPDVLRIGRRSLHYAVSDNTDAHDRRGPGSPPLWAVNIHGYFAGGRMYWRESARLAERFGWRVVNPSLPGFGGSDPLGWHEVSILALAEQVRLLTEHLGTGPVLLLGHSMGGAVAVRYAHDHPADTLGIVYRDGVATPAWRDRRGAVQTVVAAVSPNVAPFADLCSAFVLDTPDLLLGRMYSTMRALVPDFRKNVRTAGLSLPVGAMLLALDLRTEVEALADRKVPILAEWGSFDRIVGTSTAEEFARCARTSVQWVPGGHSWMLARPQGQADVLSHLRSGQRFVEDVERRRRALSRAEERLSKTP